MVTTRSQKNRIREIESKSVNRASDNESDTSFLEVLSREQMTELDCDDFLNRRRDTEGNILDQCFRELNRQIGDLTNIVLTLTQQVSSSNGEGN